MCNDDARPAFEKKKTLFFSFEISANETETEIGSDCRRFVTIRITAECPGPLSAEVREREKPRGKCGGNARRGRRSDGNGKLGAQQTVFPRRACCFLFARASRRRPPIRGSPRVPRRFRARIPRAPQQRAITTTTTFPRVRGVFVYR